MGWGLKAAVGLTNEGTQCPNLDSDQQQVAELLDAVGLPTGGTSLETLPPIESGSASAELCEAIRGFQTVQAGLVDDARVDVNGSTWSRLIELGAPGTSLPGGIPLLLVVSDLNVIELPQSASGLPSLIYTIQGPVATFEGPGIRIELSVNGPITVSWGSTFPIACMLSPDMAAMEAAVASGAARSIGGSALDNLCSKLKVESRQAVGNLFAAVTLTVDTDGTPVLGGSIGDDTRSVSMAFDPFENAVIYTFTKQVFQNSPVTAGDVQLTGQIQLKLKVTSGQDFEASVGTLVAVAAAGVVVLAPVVAWAAAAGGSEVGVGAGVRQLLIRLGPALSP